MFTGYQQEIKRADAIRYFLLDFYGGLYVDLDFEALQPIKGLLDGHGLVIGQEPYEHSRVLYDVDRLMCNAFMASCPHHPFWSTVHTELEARKHIVKGGKHVMDATGPRLINDVVRAYEGSTAAEMYPLFVPEADAVYPHFDFANPNLRPICQNKTGVLSPRRVAPCEKLEQNAYQNAPLTAASFAVHHWQHSWVGFGYFEMDEINATELVADVRAGRATKLLSAYSPYTGDEGAWGGDWDGIAAISSSCEADKQRFCSDVRPGEHRTHKCLEKAKAENKLSFECATSATFKKAKRRPPPNWAVTNVDNYQTPSNLFNDANPWTADQILGITAECEADKKKHCSDIKPGGHRTHKCLEAARKEGKVSAACADSGTFLQQQQEEEQQQQQGEESPIPGITAECEADKKKHCSDIKPGGHRTHKCLEAARKEGKVSAACADSASFV